MIRQHVGFEFRVVLKSIFNTDIADVKAQDEFFPCTVLDVLQVLDAILVVLVVCGVDETQQHELVLGIRAHHSWRGLLWHNELGGVFFEKIHFLHRKRGVYTQVPYTPHVLELADNLQVVGLIQVLPCGVCHPKHHIHPVQLLGRHLVRHEKVVVCCVQLALLHKCKSVDCVSAMYSFSVSSAKSLYSLMALCMSFALTFMAAAKSGALCCS